MENERPTRLMTFRPAWNRILHSPGFWINVISVMLFSFISPYILEFLIQNLGRLPVEIIEALRQGSGYNIGLFTVSSLENIDLAYCDGIICGVFSGSATQCMLMLIPVRFLAREFSNGYLTYALIHGQKRSALYLKYMAFNVTVFCAAAVLCMICVWISLTVAFGAVIHEPGKVFTVLLVQLIMMTALVICFSSVTFAMDGKGGTIIEIVSLFSFPLVPVYFNMLCRYAVNMESDIPADRIVQHECRKLRHRYPDCPYNSRCFLHIGVDHFFYEELFLILKGVNHVYRACYLCFLTHWN